MRSNLCALITLAFSVACSTAAVAGDADFSAGAFEAPVKAANIGRAWAAEGFSCTTTNLTAGYDVTRTNIIDERIAVVRGGLDVTVGGRSHTLAPGDAIHLPAGSERRQTTGKRPLSVIAFGYGPYDAPRNRCE